MQQVIGVVMLTFVWHSGARGPPVHFMGPDLKEKVTVPRARLLEIPVRIGRFKVSSVLPGGWVSGGTGRIRAGEERSVVEAHRKTANHDRFSVCCEVCAG